jgi:hypothetical protein
MKKLLLTFLLLIALNHVFSQNYILPVWSVGNAKLSQLHKFIPNTNLSSKYNFNNKFQLASNILYWSFAPNIQAKFLTFEKKHSIQKKKFYSKWRFSLAYVPTLFVPTLAFKLNSYLKLYTPQYLPSKIFPTLDNLLILSIPMKSKICGYNANLLSFKFGLRYSFIADSNFVLPQSPLWHSILYTFKNKKLSYFGLQIDYKILNNLNISSDFLLYTTSPYKTFQNYSFFYFGFGFHKKLTIAIGYVFTYYPKTFDLYPLFNIKIKPNGSKKSDVSKYLKIYQ